ncbi:MAG: DUF2019 domain-containing protein [Methyloceanibacter sp.]|uniref:DUF2019 domain-containing protein n=1 Tax=Methyloceanibacter sp. TaxID=1965321 RepID=UPI003D6CE19F
MTGLSLQELTTDQLVGRFVENTLAQDEALLEGERAQFNRLFTEMRAILEELTARKGDQRRTLFPLYDHPNSQVRLKAAKNTLALAPDEARNVIQAIASSGEYPQAGEAGMCLRNLDAGVFKPS